MRLVKVKKKKEKRSVSYWNLGRKTNSKVSPCFTSSHFLRSYFLFRKSKHRIDKYKPTLIRNVSVLAAVMHRRNLQKIKAHVTVATAIECILKNCLSSDGFFSRSSTELARCVQTELNKTKQ